MKPVRTPNADSMPSTTASLKEAFKRAGVRYSEANTKIATEFAAEQPGQTRNAIGSSIKAITTRVGKFGETKLKPETHAQMDKKGFKVRPHKGSGQRFSQDIGKGTYHGKKRKGGSK